MVSCFRKHDVGIREFSSIETKSHHTTTRVVHVIGYTKCTQTPKIIPYSGFRYTLPVPMMRWVHLFVPKTIGMHTFFYRSYIGCDYEKFGVYIFRGLGTESVPQQFLPVVEPAQ